MLMALVIVMVMAPHASLATTVPSSIHIVSPYVLTIDGVERIPPVDVGNETHIVCAEEMEPVTTGTLSVFRGWYLDGVLVSTSTCLEIGAGTNITEGTLRAIYETVYLVTIQSNPPVYYSAKWGVGNVTISAPERIVINDTIYVFKEWSFGGVEPEVTIFIASPTTVIAKYSALYPVYIDNKLVGNYPSGHILRIPKVVNHTGTARTVIKSVIVNGGRPEGEDDNYYYVRVTGPMHIITERATEVLVRVVTPSKTTEVWVENGTDYTLNADQAIPISSDERLVFVEWEPLGVSIPTYTVKINGSTTFTAIYKHEYAVVVKTPLGDSKLYVREGRPATIYVPPEFPGLFSSRVLSYFVINGSKKMTPTDPGLLVIPDIRGPTTVSAIYVYTVLWSNVVVVALLIAVIGLLYLLYTREIRVKALCNTGNSKQ